MKIKRLAAAFAAATLAFSIAAAPIEFMGNTVSESGVVYAAEYYKKVNGFILEKDSDGDIYVSDYEGSGGKITIPKQAKYVGKEAFKNNTSITAVTFPAGTARYGIGEEAFAWCTNLKSVTISGDMGAKEYDGIGAGAFKGCHQLKTVTFTDKDSYLAFVGEEAFLSCYALTKINLPSGTAKVMDRAFVNCASLSTITIPKNTKIDGAYAFGYMYGTKTRDEYYDFIYKDKTKLVKYVKATGKSSVVWEVSARTFDEANEAIKATYGNTAEVYGYGEYDDNGEFQPYEYSFCYPIKQKKITLTVSAGSAAEKWAKTNKISYKTGSDKTGSTSSLDAPTNLDATKTKNSVTLVWDEVEGADAYKVYVYNNKTGKYSAYKTVKTETCKVTKLSPNTKYKFKVVSLKKSGDKYVAGEYATISVTTKK